MNLIIDGTEKEIADLMIRITKSANHEDYNNLGLATQNTENTDGKSEFPEMYLDYDAINKRICNRHSK